ncbi:hypothetical protein [Streptomyces scabiei]|uniref:hypothetical protein n=1 Tax=Streptomyces scabiei TaxID=1930 RepID=UPI00068DAE86|nr:hypothetical protein [Streptomyces scabiei]MDX2837333.1 hypothetical protein [Streptomyces scabiei]MDX3681897.1 hypothetical protein [Streptomyces scabiei]
MTHNFGFRLAHAAGHYGLSADADGWPASLQHAAPFLSIVVDELGPDEAGTWIDGARRAFARENEARLARTYKFDFPHYLTLELGDFENTLARVAAWEALKAVHELARHEDANLDMVLDCARRAVTREAAATGTTAFTAQRS